MPAAIWWELTGAAVPNTGELDFRRRQCQHQAAGLRTQVEKIEQQARVAERWAKALPCSKLIPLPPTPRMLTPWSTTPG